MKLSRIALLLLPVLAASLAFAKGTEVPRVKGAEPGEWTQDYDAALALAKTHRIPVLLKFTSSDWCGWCQLMEREVFSKNEFEKWADGRVMLVTLDEPKRSKAVPEEYKTRNKRLREENGAGWPTYIIKDAEGKLLGRIVGAKVDIRTPAGFIRWFEECVGTMPEKVVIPNGTGSSPVDQWLQSHCSVAQRQAFSTRLTAEERAEFPSLISAEQDARAALEALQKERQAFIDGVKKELAALSPDEAATRKAKAMEELRALDASQKAKTEEIENGKKAKSARLAELLAKLR